MTVPVIALLLNAGMSANGNGRRGYLILDARGLAIDAIKDDGRGSAVLDDKYPGLRAFEELKTTPAELKATLKRFE